MSPDDLRARLRAVLETEVAGSEVECPTCRGSGHIKRTTRTLTQTDAAEAIGTTRTSITNFLSGRQTFGMDVTLRLIDWLDATEKGVVS